MSAITRDQFLDALRRSILAGGHRAAEALSAVPGDPAAMWAGCLRGDILLWLASWAGVDRRLVVGATCAAVRPALGYIPQGEDRPRLAIEAAEAWARGEEGVTVDSVGGSEQAAYAAWVALRASTRSNPSAMAASAAAQYAALAAFRDSAAVDAVAAAADVASADPALAVLFAGAADALARGLVRTAYMAAVADCVRTQIPWPVVEAVLTERGIA